jgi:hypothetical protein
MSRIGVWALAGLLLVACGDDDDGKSPKQQCEDLINTFCDRATSCAVDADILEESYSPAELKVDCREAIDAELGCDDADEIGDNYSECLSDLRTFSCDLSNEALLQDMPSFAAPPTSCDGAILFIRPTED